jgi:antitoxin FitA
VAHITISVTEEGLRKLQELAARLAISPEELARLSVEELLAPPDAEFVRAMDHVLKKNSELYRRLA